MRLSGSIVALVTPWREDGSVDVETLAQLISWHVDAGTDAILLAGSTGEGSSLTKEERRDMLRTAVDVVAGALPIIMGTGTNDTRTSVHHTEEALALGADACMAVVPYYNRPTPAGCLRHFAEIAQVGLPVVIYHHPGRTGVRLSAAELARCAEIEGIIAVKDCSGDFFLAGELLRTSSCPLFAGDDALALPLAVLGGAGTLSVVANLIPELWAQLHALMAEGCWEEARRVYDHCYPLVRALNLDLNPQAIKCALALAGRCSGRVRLPLVETPPLIAAQIAHALALVGEVYPSPCRQ